MSAETPGNAPMTVHAGRRAWALLATVLAMALVATGLAPAAHAAPGFISGTITVPAGVAPHVAYVNAYRFNAEDGRWILHRASFFDAPGPFTLDVNAGDVDYRLEIYSTSNDTLVRGFYTGQGKPTVAEPANGAPVRIGATDVQLDLITGVPLRGTFSLPEHRASASEVTVYVGEFSADGLRDVGSRSSLTLKAPFDGTWEIPHLRPGGQYYLRASFYISAGNSAGGYYHALSDGYVGRLEWATPVTPGERPHISIARTTQRVRLGPVRLPEVRGDARVGTQLTVSEGTWSLAGVQSTYQWLRDGNPVPRATGTSYTLTVADQGSRMAVRVRGARSDFMPVHVTSALTSAVTPGAAPRATKAPSVSGTARLGSTLKASTGTWSASGATYSYQWRRGGKAIKGATKRTYKLKKADVGKRVSVRVTASLAGRDDGASSSAAKKVAKGKPKVTAKVKNVKAGKRAKVVVRVKVAGLAKPRGTVRVKYGKKTIKVKLAAKRKGKVAVRLPKLAKGKYKIRVIYKPNAKAKKFVTKAKSKKVSLRVR